MDMDKYIMIRSDRHMKELTIKIEENGNIKISKNIRDTLSKNVSIYVSKNYGELLLDPNGDELLIKSNGVITAKYSIENFDRKKVEFPMKYKMRWYENEKLWKGKLMASEDIITRRQKTAEEIKALI